MERREFTVLAAMAGLSALVAPGLLLHALRRVALPAARADEPLLGGLQAASERLARNEITQDAFVREAQARFAAIDLPDKVQSALPRRASGKQRSIELLWTGNIGGSQSTLMVFLIAPQQSHPAHAHHDVASAQCVVRGRVHVRQYARVRRLDPTTLALRPTVDRLLVPYDTILATEQLDNVHWFGAEDSPAVIVNYNVNGGLRDTFDPAGSRPTGRYYVDATVSARVDGLIAAPELNSEEATGRFAHRALSAFASPFAPPQTS